MSERDFVKHQINTGLKKINKGIISCHKNVFVNLLVSEVLRIQIIKKG